MGKLIKLTFLKGEKAGESRTFSPPGVFIGREEDNDLQLLSEKASQYHAKILYENGKWLLHDLNSSNGTEVNGKKIERPVELENKDVVYFADEAFRFELQNNGIKSPEKKSIPEKLDDDADDCIRIRSPEEAKKQSADSDSDRIDKRVSEKPVKPAKTRSPDKNKILEARKMRRLVEETVAEKRRQIRKVLIILTIIINAVILYVWYRIHFF